MRNNRREFDPVYAKQKARENIQKLQEMLQSELFNNKNTQPALEGLSVILETDLNHLQKANISDTDIQKLHDQYQVDPKEYMKEHIMQLMAAEKLDPGLADNIINELEGVHSNNEAVKSEPPKNRLQSWATFAHKNPAEEDHKERNKRRLYAAGAKDTHTVDVFGKMSKDAAAIKKQLDSETAGSKTEITPQETSNSKGIK